MRRIIQKIARLLVFGHGTTVRNSTVGAGVRIEGGAKVIGSTLGHDAYIGPESRLFGVDLGPYASVGPRVTVGENEHEKKLFSTSDMLFECIERNTYEMQKASRTEIGADVWIGANAFIRKGVRIGVGAIVGAHAVVLKDVPPYAVMVGVPARMIAYRFTPETCRQLEASRWWTLNKAKLQSAIVSRYGRTETSIMQSEQEILNFIESLSAAAET